MADVAATAVAPAGVRWFGYAVYDSADAVDEIAGYTNVVVDRGWLVNGDATVRAARSARLPVVVTFHRTERKGIEEKLIPFIRANRDAIIGVGWDTPWGSEGYTAEDVDRFGRAIKDEFPGLQFWASFTKKPAGRYEDKPVPKEVDVVVVVQYYDRTPDAVRRKSEDILPGWVEKAGDKPLLLRWTSRALRGSQASLIVQPGTMRMCARMAKEHGLDGLIFDQYGVRADGWSPGIETSPSAVREIRELSRELGVTKPDRP